jgi:outer membrane protein assembly factor BamB
VTQRRRLRGGRSLPSPRRGGLAALVSVGCLLGLVAPAAHAADWTFANGDLSSTRAVPASPIDATSVKTLHVAWRFHFKVPPGESGELTATPVVALGVVYLQDMQSNVYALDLTTGALRWKHLFGDTNPGPDGVAVVGDRVYGATDESAFALSATTGKVLWRRSLVSNAERYVDVAPQVANGSVYVSTIGIPPNGHGSLFALSARTGKLRWRRSTIKAPWRIPSEAGGGGAWYPPSVDGDTLYWGTTNPYPYGGSDAHPNGGAFAGPALYTDSLLAVRARDGKLAWYDQVTPHDVRDYDFQEPPVLADVNGRSLVLGAGKAGIVIAWDRTTHRRVWQTSVGEHRNDSGPLPLKRTTVCPGLLGGAETPMAYAEGMLFVPLVDLCMRGGARGYEEIANVNVARRGKGELVAIDAATGALSWQRKLPQADFGCATVANGVVFTSTFDGQLYAFDTHDGTPLWSARASAGINSCPSLAGTTLLVGAGVPRAGGVTGLTAYVTGSSMMQFPGR